MKFKVCDPRSFLTLFVLSYFTVLLHLLESNCSSCFFFFFVTGIEFSGSLCQQSQKNS